MKPELRDPPSVIDAAEQKTPRLPSVKLARDNPGRWAHIYHGTVGAQHVIHPPLAAKHPDLDYEWHLTDPADPSKGIDLYARTREP